MYRFVSNITFKSDTYEGRQEYNPPIIFDNERYNYYIKILNVRFSNNIPNVKNDLVLGIDSTNYTISAGLYEVADLLSIINEQQNILTFSINENTGHIIMKNTTSTAHTLSGNMLTSLQFGVFTVSSIGANETLTSPEMASVSDSNFYKLCSQMISPASYESQNGKLVTTNVIYTFAATIDKFGHKDFAAFQDIAYPLGMEQLQHIDFELQDENGKQVYPISGAKSDFNVQCVIVKERKN